MIDFLVDFFRDEVRCGFYIPTAIKQAWAAELTVLSEIDRICEKHGIRYFADWGTMLGAVRHGGFVPWDDDLDICMLREDYVKFREVADAELPEEYVIHDYERQEDHWLFLARVVNNDKICFDPEYLNKHYNFPWLAGVDIFVKDYLYADPAKEKERDDEVMHILTVADSIVDGSLKEDEAEKWLRKFEKQYHINIDRTLNARQRGIRLYRLAEQQMARVAAEDAETVGQIFPFILKGGAGQPKKYYEEILRLPFENTTIPVPASYDTMLRNRYGDYLTIRKVWGGHDYPFFEGQRAELQSHADFTLPEYRFDRRVLNGPKRSISEVTQKRRILFLAAGPMWWSSLADLYEKECSDSEAEVRVVALPMLMKNCYGEIDATDEELAMAAREDEYPEDIILTPWYDFEIEQFQPDRCYIQDVYDGENPVLSVPAMYHSSHVRDYTNELILVPPIGADDFTSEDRNDLYGLKHYAKAPGAVYADKVLVRSEVIRERYLEVLTEWAGDDAREYWERKIQVNAIERKDSNISKEDGRKKTLLFMIGANEVAEYHGKAAEMLQKKLSVIRSSANSLDVMISLYPPELECWDSGLTEGKDAFLQQVEDALPEYGFCDLRENNIDEIVGACDAYYGSSSPLVVEFVRAKKPVMVADYRV